LTIKHIVTYRPKEVGKFAYLSQPQAAKILRVTERAKGGQPYQSTGTNKEPVEPSANWPNVISQSDAGKMLNVSDRQADILMEQGRGNIKTPLPIIDKRVSEECKHLLK